jgi:hypothetical protein
MRSVFPTSGAQDGQICIVQRAWYVDGDFGVAWSTRHGPEYFREHPKLSLLVSLLRERVCGLGGRVVGLGTSQLDTCSEGIL